MKQYHLATYILVLTVLLSCVLPLTVSADSPPFGQNIEYSNESTLYSKSGLVRDLLMSVNDLPLHYKDWSYYTVNDVGGDNSAQIKYIFDALDGEPSLFFRDSYGTFHPYLTTYDVLWDISYSGYNWFSLYYDSLGADMQYNLSNLTSKSDGYIRSCITTIGLNYKKAYTDKETSVTYIPLSLATYDLTTDDITIHNKMSNYFYIRADALDQTMILLGLNGGLSPEVVQTKNWNDESDTRYQLNISSNELRYHSHIYHDEYNMYNTPSYLSYNDIIEFDNPIYLYDVEKGVQVEPMYCNRYANKPGFFVSSTSNSTDMISYYTKVLVGEDYQVIRRFKRGFERYDLDFKKFSFGLADDLNIGGKTYKQLYFLQAEENVNSYKQHLWDTIPVNYDFTPYSIALDNNNNYAFSYWHTTSNHVLNDMIDSLPPNESQIITDAIGDVIENQATYLNSEDATKLNFYYGSSLLDGSDLQNYHYNYLTDNSIYQHESTYTVLYPDGAFVPTENRISWSIQHKRKTGSLIPEGVLLRNVSNFNLYYRIDNAESKSPDRIKIYLKNLGVLFKEVLITDISEYMTIDVIDDVKIFEISIKNDILTFGTDLQIDEIVTYFEYDNNINAGLIDRIDSIVGSKVYTRTPTVKVLNFDGSSATGGIMPEIDIFYRENIFGDYDNDYNTILDFYISEINLGGISSLMNIIYAIFGMFGSLIFMVLVIFIIKKLLV